MYGYNTSLFFERNILCCIAKVKQWVRDGVKMDLKFEVMMNGSHGQFILIEFCWNESW